MGQESEQSRCRDKSLSGVSRTALFLPDAVAQITWKATFLLYGGLNQSCSMWNPKFARRDHGSLFGPRCEREPLFVSTRGPDLAQVLLYVITSFSQKPTV